MYSIVVTYHLSVSMHSPVTTHRWSVRLTVREICVLRTGILGSILYTVHYTVTDTVTALRMAHLSVRQRMHCTVYVTYPVSTLYCTVCNIVLYVHMTYTMVHRPVCTVLLRVLYTTVMYCTYQCLEGQPGTGTYILVDQYITYYSINYNTVQYTSLNYLLWIEPWLPVYSTIMYVLYAVVHHRLCIAALQSSLQYCTVN